MKRTYEASLNLVLAILAALILLTSFIGGMLGGLVVSVKAQTDEVAIENGDPMDDRYAVLPKEPTQAAPEAARADETEPEVISLGEFKITAYCACAKCCGKWAANRPVDENGKEIVYTASGEIAQQGRTIAVDPSVIPYGTMVFFGGQAWVAEDTGSGIKGNRIDVYFDNHEDAKQWGVGYYEVSVEKEST